MNSIEIYKGDTLSLPVTVTNEDGSIFSLVGYSMKMTVKQNIDDSDTDAKIPTKTAVIATPSSGIGIFTFTATETNLPAGKYWYDVVIYKTSPDIRQTIILDEFIVIEDVTNSI